MQYVPADTLRTISARIADLCPGLFEAEQIMVAFGQHLNIWPDYCRDDLIEDSVRTARRVNRDAAAALARAVEEVRAARELRVAEMSDDQFKRLCADLDDAGEADRA